MKNYIENVDCSEISCPLCDYKTNSYRGLGVHANHSHGVKNIDLYDMLNPDCQKICKCGGSLKYVGLKEGYEESCGRCRRKAAMKNYTSWNKGLTKESDNRLKKVSEKISKHYEINPHHMVGKTKDNCEIVARKGKKISEALKKHYENNESWAKGLTSENSQIIREKSLKSSLSQKGRKMSDEHRKKLKKIDEETKPTSKNMDDHESLWRLEVYDYIGSLGANVNCDNQTVLSGKRIDVFTPDQNFGIICVDLSNRFSSQESESKRLMAKERNILLWTLFEDEWRDKKEIVKSMIRHRLGISESRVYARNCEVKRVNPQQLKGFIDENHIEGYVNASFGIGLYFDSELIGACTLRWKTGSKKQILELGRLCLRMGYHVPGGLSKLVAVSKQVCVEQGVKTLFSYADNRFGGDSYAKAGLKLVGNTANRWWWTDFKTRYDRFKYRADKSVGLTEKEVASRAGVWKIWGCSNSRYEIAIN